MGQANFRHRDACIIGAGSFEGLIKPLTLIIKGIHRATSAYVGQSDNKQFSTQLSGMAIT